MIRKITSLFKEAHGLTLIELLMAMAMGSILIAAIYGVYTAQVKGQLVQEASLELQQGLRSAMQQMKNEIRTAGMDPTGRAGAGIVMAAPDQFRFTRDIDDENGSGRFDGRITLASEDIRYALNTGDLARETCRPSGSGGWICSGLRRIMNDFDALNFVYLDQDGNRIDYADLLTDEERDQIAQVQLTLVARYDHSRTGFMGRITDNHVYRNRFGDILVDGSSNPASRRLKMSATIALRNKSHEH